MENRRFMQLNTRSPPALRNLSVEWPTLVTFVQRLTKMCVRLALTICQLSVFWRGRTGERKWAGMCGGGGKLQTGSLFAHTLMAEMTAPPPHPPWGPQHACAISEFHTPAPLLWARLLLWRCLDTQRTQPQLVYGRPLSQMEWSPHIKVPSLWNCGGWPERPNGRCLLI